MTTAEKYVSQLLRFKMSDRSDFIIDCFFFTFFILEKTTRNISLKLVDVFN